MSEEWQEILAEQRLFKKAFMMEGGQINYEFYKQNRELIKTFKRLLLKDVVKDNVEMCKIDRFILKQLTQEIADYEQRNRKNTHHARVVRYVLDGEIETKGGSGITDNLSA